MEKNQDFTISNFFIMLGYSSLGPSDEALRNLLSRGLTPYVLSLRAIIEPKEFSEQVCFFSFDNEKELEDFFINRIDAKNLKGIMTIRDEYVVIASKLAKKFGLPGPNYESMRYLHSKVNQKSEFKKHGFRTPTSIALSVKESCTPNNFEFDYPLIIKPSIGSASHGVFKVLNSTDLSIRLQDFRDGSNDDNCFLVEECIQGDEYAVEVFDGHVMGIVTKRISLSEDFSEVGYIANETLPKDLKHNLIHASEQVCLALNLTWGPIHIDFIANKAGLYIIEVNARLAGSFIPELILDAYSVDMVDLLISKCLNADTTHQYDKKNNRMALVDFIFKPTESLALSYLHNIQCTTEKLKNSKVVIGERFWAPKERVGYIYLSFDK